MTNAQMYIAIGIPALLILVNISFTLHLVDRLDLRMDEFEGHVDSLISKLELRFDRMQADMDGRFARIDADLRRFFELFGRHDEALEILKKRI